VGIAERLLVRQLRFRDMPAAFRTASLVVYPTDREGLGLSALEAMALRRPLVATDAEGIREIVTNERDGYLYAPGQTDHLAQIMARILRDPRHAAEIGERARATVTSRFSSISMAARHLEVYRSLAL
jgi:glycosyltransferase involved in cell wall biosynthesis